MSGYQVSGTYSPRGPRGGHRPKGPKGLIGPVASVFMNLHVKCLIFSAKDDEDMGSHPLHGNGWMTS